MKRIAVAFVLTAFLGCSGAAKPANDESTKVLQALGASQLEIDKISTLITGTEPLTTLDENFNEIPVSGTLIRVEKGMGLDALQKIRFALAASKLRSYLFENAFGYGPDKIALTVATDEEYLSIARTDGINYDISHQKVADKYRLWKEKYGLELVGAGRDWLEAKITKEPEDWNNFAEEVYKFCPDVVEQGSGSVGALAKEMEKASTLYLWWD